MEEKKNEKRKLKKCHIKYAIFSNEVRPVGGVGWGGRCWVHLNDVVTESQLNGWSCLGCMGGAKPSHELAIWTESSTAAPVPCRWCRTEACSVAGPTNSPS